jgi:hypothetical protein
VVTRGRALPGRLRDDGVGLDLNEQRRVDELADLDHRRAGPDVAEDLPMNSAAVASSAQSVGLHGVAVTGLVDPEAALTSDVTGSYPSRFLGTGTPQGQGDLAPQVPPRAGHQRHPVLADHRAPDQCGSLTRRRTTAKYRGVTAHRSACHHCYYRRVRPPFRAEAGDPLADDGSNVHAETAAALRAAQGF